MAHHVQMSFLLFYFHLFYLLIWLVHVKFFFNYSILNFSHLTY